MNKWRRAGKWVNDEKINTCSRFTRPPVINSDYRGQRGVILINLGDAPFTIAHGARVAQMVAAPAPQALFAELAEIGEAERGAGGFGSAGRS